MGTYAGEHDRDREYRRCATEDERIARVDVGRHRLKDAAQGERTGESQHDPDASHDDPLAHDDRPHLAGARSQRHAHPDLMLPLRHREGEDAVDADRGEREGDGAEDQHQEEDEAIAREVLRDDGAPSSVGGGAPAPDRARRALRAPAGGSSSGGSCDFTR